ncbi:hypothetical protein ACIA98_06570 [Streptomyces sp. NPDC051366]|uniref:hypothetical protein n=1 Tax=Streptomyces sp. NPDC051366 TaxID=3365652 RepID=UPI003794B6CF
MPEVKRLLRRSARDGVTFEEPGHGFGDRPGLLDVKEVAHAFGDVLLDLGHVRAEELGDFDPQRPGVAAEHGQHRPADRRGLIRAEAPLGQGRELDPEERVGVLDRLRAAAGYPLVEQSADATGAPARRPNGPGLR